MTRTAEAPQQTKSGTTSTADNGVGNLAEQVKEQASQTLQQAQDQIDAGLQFSSGEMQRIANEGQAFVKKNPGLAVAGALGAGVLLGLAMRSRF